MFKIDTADYMISISGSDALRELSSPGKSGSIFFLSQDDQFMIKTLRKSEVQVLYHFQLLIANSKIQIPAQKKSKIQMIWSLHISPNTWPKTDIFNGPELLAYLN